MNEPAESKGPWLTAFGACGASWNLEDPDYATEDSDESGRPGIGVVGEAITTWAILNQRYPTVAEAAMVFNLSPDLVREAVNDWPWAYVTPEDTIGLDGA